MTDGARIGGGKYDACAEAMLHATGGRVIVLLVVDGINGTGMSMSVDAGRAGALPDLAAMLREVASKLEAGKPPGC